MHRKVIYSSCFLFLSLRIRIFCDLSLMFANENHAYEYLKQLIISILIAHLLNTIMFKGRNIQNICN